MKPLLSPETPTLIPLSLSSIIPVLDYFDLSSTYEENNIKLGTSPYSTLVIFIDSSDLSNYNLEDSFTPKELVLSDEDLDFSGFDPKFNFEQQKGKFERLWKELIQLEHVVHQSCSNKSSNNHHQNFF